MPVVSEGERKTGKRGRRRWLAVLAAGCMLPLTLVAVAPLCHWQMQIGPVTVSAWIEPLDHPDPLPWRNVGAWSVGDESRLTVGDWRWDLDWEP